MSNSTSTNLRGKLHVKHGFPFKGKYFSNKGKYIVLTPGNFYEEGGFKRQVGKEKYYIEDIPEEYLHNKGDLIVAMTEQAAGLLGSCAFVPESGVYLHNQRLGLITTDAKILNHDFVYYLFKTRSVREQIRLTSTGSKVKHTSPERIYDVNAHLPSVKEQKKIVSILSTLDAKIDLNNRINTELESMAKTLYDYWFVQFDFPISKEQAKAMSKPRLEGRPYKSSGGKMVYNSTLKREIPEGWEVKSLLDIAEFTNGIACQKYRPTDENYLNVIKIREMRTGFTGSTEKVTHNIPDKVKIFDGDILFSWSASLEVIMWTGGKGALNQHLFKVTSDAYPKAFLYLQLLDYVRYFIVIAESRKTTMGHITRGHLAESRISVPPEYVLEQFSNYLSSCLDRKLVVQSESLKLIQLRDYLLPMLMNGQVTVK